MTGIALLLPSPTPHWSLSVAYYWQWAEGQSKVVETLFLLLSFYLGKTGRPVLSGASLALSAFDPRFTLVAMPLFILYNRRTLGLAAASGLAVFLATNAVLLYPPIGSGFLEMLFSSGLSTPLYYYALIPLLTVLALTAANVREIVSVLKGKSIN